MKYAWGIAVLMFAAAFVGTAGEGGGGGPGGGGKGPKGPPPPPPLGMVIQIALNHKTDLGLSDDQVTALEKLGQSLPEPKGPKGGQKPPPPPKDGNGGGDGAKPPKGPPGDGGPLKDILSADQLEKLKELVKAEKPDGPPPPPPPGGGGGGGGKKGGGGKGGGGGGGK